MSVEVLATAPFRLASPSFDSQNNLFMTCTQSGSVLRFDASRNVVGVAMETEGHPSGIAIDPQTNETFLADTARQCIVKVEIGADGKSTVAQFVHQFEGRSLLGPHALCFDKDRELIFTDSGLPGDSSLSRPRGAVYRTVQQRQQLVRLCGPILAYPTGVATGPDGCIYVAEQCSNRVLRFTPKPEGHFFGSVFAQLSGSMGPVAVAVHPVTKNVYVAKYEQAGIVEHGSVVVLSPAGEELGVIALPATQLSGVAIDLPGSHLIVTEDGGANANSRVFRVAL